MQSGAPAFGTPESAVGLLCTGQIARHYGLPFRSGGGLTASQSCDAQAAYEALMTMLPTFLAGTNWVMHSAGWLESGLVSCYEKFIVDIELLRMLQEEFKPFEITEESLAWDAHQEVGHGGHFFGAAHTLEHFRDCFYRPLLSSTANFERWQRLGGDDATARAPKIWHDTLDATSSRRSTTRSGRSSTSTWIAAAPSSATDARHPRRSRRRAGTASGPESRRSAGAPPHRQVHPHHGGDHERAAEHLDPDQRGAEDDRAGDRGRDRLAGRQQPGQRRPDALEAGEERRERDQADDRRRRRSRSSREAWKSSDSPSVTSP